MTNPFSFPHQALIASAARIVSAMLVLVPLFSLPACTKPDKPTSPGAQTPPAAGSTAGYTLELTPPDPTRNSTLLLTPKGFFLTDARIVWMVNGAADPDASAVQYQATGAARGDTIMAKAVLKDGEVL